jgi:hypothetical protein
MATSQNRIQNDNSAVGGMQQNGMTPSEDNS